MEEHINDFIHKIYYFLKLSLLVNLGWLLGFCGLTALAAAVDTHQAAQNQEGQLSIRYWWQTYKAIFKVTWHLSWAYNLTSIFLLWLIWFTSQFKGLVFLMALFIQIAALGLVILTAVIHANLYPYIEASIKNQVSLAVSLAFVTTIPNILFFAYLVFIALVFRAMPALVVFLGSGLAIRIFHPLYLKYWRDLGLF